MLTAQPIRTPTSNVATFDREGFESFLASRREPAWLTDRRRSAFEIYRELLSTELDPEE